MLTGVSQSKSGRRRETHADTSEATSLTVRWNGFNRARRQALQSRARRILINPHPKCYMYRNGGVKCYQRAERRSQSPRAPSRRGPNVVLKAEWTAQTKSNSAHFTARAA